MLRNKNARNNAEGPAAAAEGDDDGGGGSGAV